MLLKALHVFTFKIIVPRFTGTILILFPTTIPSMMLAAQAPYERTTFPFE